jgi:hypothetical protein
MSIVQKRGITEKSLYVLNPLPPITDAEVLEKAKLDDLSVPRNTTPLTRTWQYSGGFEKEVIVLRPGERQAMRESDASACIAEIGEQGLVTHELDATPEQIEAAVVAGVKKAITFYTDRGAKRLKALRKIHSQTQAELEEDRHQHWSFYYNQALAELLRAYLAQLTKKPKAAPKPAAA